ARRRRSRMAEGGGIARRDDPAPQARRPGSADAGALPAAPVAAPRDAQAVGAAISARPREPARRGLGLVRGTRLRKVRLRDDLGARATLTRGRARWRRATPP